MAVWDQSATRIAALVGLLKEAQRLVDRAAVFGGDTADIDLVEAAPYLRGIAARVKELAQRVSRTTDAREFAKRHVAGQSAREFFGHWH